MLRVATLILSVVVAGAATAQGQQCVTDSGRPTSAVNTIGLSFGSSIASFDVECAIAMWSSACGQYGSQFPAFSTTSGDLTITIIYSPTQNDAGCGDFTPLVNNATGRLVGGTITLYETDVHGMSCQGHTIDTIAHELGHVLGLENSPCLGYMMGPSLPGSNESVQPAECEEVEDNWRTDGECLDENQNGVCDLLECPDTNGNGVCDDREDPDKDPNEDSCPGGPPCSSPLLIHLDQGRWQLSGSEDPVTFDIDADGVRNRITWTARGSAVAFLAVDRNQNGVIDDGGELFGNWTRLSSGATAANGFEVLREFDSNTDGLVDQRDQRWPALLLWTDVNHDGISQRAELKAIDDSPVRALETSYHWTGRRDSSGNLFAFEGLVHFRSGGRRPFYDVFFRTVP